MLAVCRSSPGQDAREKGRYPVRLGPFIGSFDWRMGRFSPFFRFWKDFQPFRVYNKNTRGVG